MSCKTYDEPSWGATLQNYSDHRTNNIISNHVMNPAKQVSKNNQNHPASRVYNPILMKFNAADKEQEYIRNEAELNLTRMNISKDKQLYFEQGHNIISNKSYNPETERKPHQRSVPSSRVDYNIVSMYPRNAQRNQEVGYLSTSCSNFEEPNSVAKTNRNARPFDILNNKYVQDHDMKANLEDIQLQHQLKEKFRSTHDYDPVEGKYYDAVKEAEYQQQVKKVEKVHGAGYLARLPPSMQYAEGAGYNIVTQDVKDPLKVESTEGAGNRRYVNKKSSLIDAEIRQRSEDQADLIQDRMHERISRTGVMKAREEGRHHGFDVVSNERHHGLGAKPLAPSRLAPPESVWAKLQSDNITYTEEYLTSKQQANLASDRRETSRNMNFNGTMGGSGRNFAGGTVMDTPNNNNSNTQRTQRSNSSRIYKETPNSTGRKSAPISSRSVPNTNRSSLSTSRSRVGGGMTNTARSARTPVVPSLHMPSNITALQNNYE